MHIRIKLLLMQEIERRNKKRIEAYTEGRQPPVQRSKGKPKRNRGRHKKRPD